MKNKKKYRDLLSFAAVIAVLFLLNFIAAKKYFRIDLTADKRFTMTDASTTLIKKLDDVVEFKVYLSGDNLPAKFVEFREEIKSRLEEFRSLNSENIEYEFIDPYNVEKPEEFIKTLTEKGLQYTNVEEKTENGVQQVYVVPGVVVYYKGREMPVNLLRLDITAPHIQVLNKSIEAIEHELTQAIRMLQTERKKNVGFLQGHGELDGLQVYDLAHSLSDYYNVGPVNLIDSAGYLDTHIMDLLNVLVIAKPLYPFTKEELYVIDQFIMRGGITVWMMDQVHAEMDSLKYSNYFPAMTNNVGTEDFLYHYGVRINNNLVEDLQCAPIQIQVGKYGNQPSFKPIPWFYSPLITTENTHIITTNLDPLKLIFASSIDTIPSAAIKKTILLSTSENTKLVSIPVRVSFDAAINGPDKKQFKAGKKALAVLLEGKFTSYYSNRIAPQLGNRKTILNGKAGKMVVISDGDIARNEIQGGAQPQPMPLGSDRNNNFYFDNKKFLLNTFNYLCGDQDVIPARSKKIEMRLLNKGVFKGEERKIQILNIALPLGFIVMFGLIYNWIRIRKYTRS